MDILEINIDCSELPLSRFAFWCLNQFEIVVEVDAAALPQRNSNLFICIQKRLINHQRLVPYDIIFILPLFVYFAISTVFFYFTVIHSLKLLIFMFQPNDFEERKHVVVSLFADQNTFSIFVDLLDSFDFPLVIHLDSMKVFSFEYDWLNLWFFIRIFSSFWIFLPRWHLIEVLR